jgi:hypothetical protein
MTDRHALDHDDDRELDELLDSALASYVDQEPDASLRTRVFSRMNEVVSPRRRIWRIWRIGSLAAAACAAALLLAFLLHPANRILRDRTLQDRAANALPATAAPPPAVSANLHDALTHSATRHIVAATRHRYYRTRPTLFRGSNSLVSAPLTEEEATLLRFAQQHPEQAREVLSPLPSGPIHIDPVVIARIQIADLSASQPDAH